MARADCTRACAAASAAQLRIAEKALLLQAAGAIGLGFGLLRTGRGFGQGRFGLRQLGAQGVALQSGQHVTALHPVAHVHAHLGDLQAIGLCANDGFLPGGQVAIGADFLGQAGRLGGGHGDREGRFSGAGGGWCLALCLDARQKSQPAKQADGPIWLGHCYSPKKSFGEFTTSACCRLGSVVLVLWESGHWPTPELPILASAHQGRAMPEFRIWRSELG
jgi:hypothetical protein